MKPTRLKPFFRVISPAEGGCSPDNNREYCEAEPFITIYPLPAANSVREPADAPAKMPAWALNE